MNITTSALSASIEDDRSAEYLAFRLGKEEYAIAIQKVNEIRGYDAVTHIANAPDYLKGVINLRGLIVPIVDMRIKFGIPNPAYDQFTVVIILSIAGRTVGIVVDGVSDVISLSGAHIKEPPDLGTHLDSSYLVGVATTESRMLLLVDIEKLVVDKEISMQMQIAA